MKLEKFLSEFSNVKAENKLLKWTIVVLACAVVVSLYFTNKAFHQEKIILVPPQIHSRIVIYGSKPSKTYLEEFTRYVCDLALNYSSATARSQFAELLTLFTPNTFKMYQKSFYNLADRVEAAGNIAHMFYISKVKINLQKKTIAVTGRELLYSGTSKLSDSASKYLIKYEFKNGRFYIVDFKRITGGENA